MYPVIEVQLIYGLFYLNMVATPPKQKTLFIPPTSKTPEIILDPEHNQFSMKGKCLPKDAEEYFRPLMEWVDQYMLNPGPSLRLDLELHYMNTSSSKEIYRFISKLKQLNSEEQNQPKRFEIRWKFDDEDMEECGRDFERVTRMDFEFYPFGDML